MQAIAQIGEPILTQPALLVTSFDEKLESLAASMLETLLQAKGVGLAAPQINHRLAMFVMASHPNERYPDAPTMEPVVIINPNIIAYSGEQEAGEEGCLSISQARYTIKRHTWIDVTYQDLQAKVHLQRLTGFVARIFQHEYDHLQGLTLIERKKMQSQSVQEPNQ